MMMTLAVGGLRAALQHRIKGGSVVEKRTSQKFCPRPCRKKNKDRGQNFQPVHSQHSSSSGNGCWSPTTSLSLSQRKRKFTRKSRGEKELFLSKKTKNKFLPPTFDVNFSRTMMYGGLLQRLLTHTHVVSLSTEKKFTRKNRRKKNQLKKKQLILVPPLLM